MKAMLYHATGGPEVLEFVDVADPEPGPADVVVRVEACALNRLDVVQRNGWYQMPGLHLPPHRRHGRRRHGRRGRRRRHVGRRRRPCGRRSVAGRGAGRLEAGRVRRPARRARRHRRHRRRWLRRAVPRARQPRVPGARRHADRARRDVPHLLPHRRPRAVRRRPADGGRDDPHPRRGRRGVGRRDPSREARRGHGARHRRHRREVRAGARDRRRPRAEQPHRRRRRLGARRHPGRRCPDGVRPRRHGAVRPRRCSRSASRAGS